MSKIIDGLKLAEETKEKVKQEVLNLNRIGKQVCLVVVLIGENSASEIYVRNKRKSCLNLGIDFKLVRFNSDASQEEIVNGIEELNSDENVDGIIVQLPIPKKFNETEVIEKISSKKDVDGITSKSVGRLVNSEETFVSCTPAGILKIIKSTGVEISGKHCVIVGRSRIVGKPLANLLLNNNATVTVCHSKTKNLSEVTKLADILISAVGKPKFITSEFVKKGAIVIDVGINRLENGKVVGDVNFEDVLNVAGYITPVPGGVGPMTVAMLMENVVKAAKLQISY